MHWCIGALVHWCIGALVHWYTVHGTRYTVHGTVINKLILSFYLQVGETFDSFRRFKVLLLVCFYLRYCHGAHGTRYTVHGTRYVINQLILSFYLQGEKHLILQTIQGIVSLFLPSYCLHNIFMFRYMNICHVINH